MGMPHALGGLSEITISTADRYMIVLFFGLFEAGLYSSGYLFGSMSLIIVRLIGLFTPQYMFLARDSEDKNAVNNLINYSFLAFFSVAIPYVFFLIQFGSEILSWANIKSDRAYLSMIMISMASIFSGVYLILSSVSIMEKKTAVQMKLMLSFSFFNVIANYFLFRIFNSFAVASMVTLVTYTLICLFFLKYLMGIWKFNFPFSFILGPLCLATGCYFCINTFELIFPNEFKGATFVGISAFASVYLIGLGSFLKYKKIWAPKKI
ncbi:polysaccharide biosynthesis C-terminal domain-containing protein [Alphaproteobacteria bacterium]|nr:polysaccharide biosynthesis C-terminal domain-containing protein [Alphaproteobacteria bacterium]MDB2431926.1 polysaccharide biosynthesis C-terminal domain-containing protein [Alphaproteobacteria bacterium]MDB2575097.1 polysaccharide biosynthesis C-terminal domain-containing protein [Alphaproteobacteria bacterium]